MNHHMQIELHGINERYIELLAHMAQHDPAPPVPLAAQIKRDLTMLDTGWRRRAAQRPFSLVDFRLTDRAWWTSAKLNAAKYRPEPWNSGFPRRSAVEIARRVLTLAWMGACGAPAGLHCARLGIAPGVAEIIATLKLEDIEQIAERYVLLMSPRWADQPDMWRRLLDAARSSDSQALQSIDVHGVQLFGSDLLAQSG